MSVIQQASSTPPYISNFINNNMTKLLEIHGEGIKEHKVGCLGFKCSQAENKMDVFFMNESMLLSLLQPDSYENLKGSMENKVLFLIQDLDKNSIFLVYL
jgi:hypothetical protein